VWIHLFERTLVYCQSHTHPPGRIKEKKREMIIPIRCFTCGAITGNKWTKYQELLAQNYTPKEALDKCGLVRYCCRRMLLTHVDLVDKLILHAHKDRRVPHRNNLGR
jgi:DNA-directed RNA polymerase I, II, and III subunit RPABC5